MNSINNSDGQLFYSKIGSGKEVLLCFHGFGQNNDFFSLWGKSLGEKYTIYAFDLFYHGKSDRNNQVLSHETWKSYIQEFLEKESIHQFSVFGFSLGGRFAISTSLTFHQQVNQLILAAPDGVVNIIWFRIATSPLFKYIFKFFVENTERLFSVVRFFEKLKLIHPYTVKFIELELKEKENGKRVYQSWNAFKNLSYPKKELIRKMNQANFRKTVFLGTRDEIVRPKKIMPILEEIGSKVFLLKKKHHQVVFDDKLNEFMISL